MQTLSTLRLLALSFATLAGAAVAAEPLLVAKADTGRSLLRSTVEAPVSSAAYPSLAEAEMIGMGYADFDVVLAEALNTPTAAGPIATRGAIEAAVAQRMGGLMP